MALVEGPGGWMVYGNSLLSGSRTASKNNSYASYILCFTYIVVAFVEAREDGGDDCVQMQSTFVNMRGVGVNPSLHPPDFHGGPHLPSPLLGY